MPELDFFESPEGGEIVNRVDGPIWKMDLDDPANEDKIFKWLQGDLQYLQNENRQRISQIRKNLSLYKGVLYKDQDVRRDIYWEKGQDKRRNFDKVVVNDFYDLTQSVVSRLLKYKPAVAILPTNDEYGDKIAAKCCGFLLDHIWYTEKFESTLTPLICTSSKVTGESYLFIQWDPNKGDLLKEYKDLQGTKVPLLDENGNALRDEQGNIVYNERPVRNGDVSYKIVHADDIYLQKKQRFELVEYCYEREIIAVEEARMRYPDRAWKIKEKTSAKVYDYTMLKSEEITQMVELWHFHHKRTDMLDGGRLITFCKDGIVYNKPAKHTHKELPCEKLGDIDRPGEPHSVSFFEVVGGLIALNNNITNIIQRNVLFCAHPKWMVPSGSVKLDTLGNDITIVQFKGPVSPQLALYPVVPSDVFQWQKDIQQEAKMKAGLFGVSRGEPPKGITAAVALQFLAEQESERLNEGVLKFNEFVRKVAIKTLSVAGDNYDPGDERFIRVLGKENKWMSMKFESAYLTKDYDVRIQNTSALPQSKAARTEYLVWLHQNFPNQITGEQVLDLLDLSQADKFLNIATVAVRAAEAENDFILDGKEVGDPAEYEQHISHWKVHTKPLQEFSFKNQTPLEIQQSLKDHILAHEMFMWNQAQKNPAFAKELASITMYPMFFVPTAQTNVADVAQNFIQGSMTDPTLSPEIPESVNAPGLGVQEDLPPISDQQMDKEVLANDPGPIEPTSGV